MPPRELIPNIGGGDWSVLMDVLAVGLSPGGVPVGGAPQPKPLPRLQATNPAFLITSFQSGHGWTSSGSGTPNLNDTSLFKRGSQCLSGLTDGAGGGFSVRRTGLPSLDWTGKIPAVLFRVDDWTNLSDMSLYMGDTTLANRFVHTFTDPLANAPTQDSMLLRNNEWGVLTVPWGVKTAITGSPNRAAITDYQLRAADKNGIAINVHWNALFAVNEQTVFPNGVVSLVFDDGWDSQYTQARLKMDQYGFPGSCYVIASQQINSVNGYMTLQQLHDLEDMNGWQIGGHAYDTAVHDAWTQATVDTATATLDMQRQKAWLVGEGFKGLEHWAMPGGNYNSGIESVAKRYYATARTLNAGNHESLAPWNPMRLRTGMYVINTTTTAAIQTQVDLAYANKTWLILVFHKIVAAPSVSTEYSIANFGTVIDYLNTKGIPVRTVNQVLGSVPATG